MNIAQLLDRSAQHFPDRTAIVFGDRHLSYQQLPQQVDRVAGDAAIQSTATDTRVEAAIIYFARSRRAADRKHRRRYCTGRIVGIGHNVIAAAITVIDRNARSSDQLVTRPNILIRKSERPSAKTISAV